MIAVKGIRASIGSPIRVPLEFPHFWIGRRSNPTKELLFHYCHQHPVHIAQRYKDMRDAMEEIDAHLVQLRQIFHHERNGFQVFHDDHICDYNLGISNLHHAFLCVPKISVNAI
jgi:hypothetical protein